MCKHNRLWVWYSTLLPPEVRWSHYQRTRPALVLQAAVLQSFSCLCYNLKAVL